MHHFSPYTCCCYLLAQKSQLLCHVSHLLILHLICWASINTSLLMKLLRQRLSFLCICSPNSCVSKIFGSLEALESKMNVDIMQLEAISTPTPTPTSLSSDAVVGSATNTDLTPGLQNYTQILIVLYILAMAINLMEAIDISNKRHPTTQIGNI